MKRHAIYLRDRVHVFRQLPNRQHTREIFITQQYDIWLCPVCGRDRWGIRGNGAVPNLYMPCWIRYCGGRRGHEHHLRAGAARARNRQLSDDRYTSRSTCRCTRDAITAMTSPSRPACRSAHPRAGSGRAVVRFPGGTDTGTSLRTGARGAELRRRHPSTVSNQRRGMDGLSRRRPHRDHHRGRHHDCDRPCGGRRGQRLRPNSHGKIVHIDGPAQCARCHAFLQNSGRTARMWRKKPSRTTATHAAFTRNILWTAEAGRLATIAGPRQTHGRPRAIIRRQCGAAFFQNWPARPRWWIRSRRSFQEWATARRRPYGNDAGRCSHRRGQRRQGYAVTTEEKGACAGQLYRRYYSKANHNGVYYIWAADKAGNISAAAKWTSPRWISCRPLW